MVYGILLAVVIGIALALSGCALPFDRTYSFGYEGATFSTTLKAAPQGKAIVPVDTD